MLVLDTNVLSALMSAEPPAPVVAWMARQLDEQLFTTSICEAEIRAGIAVLPQGRRRQLLDDAAHGIFTEEFRGRVIPFDGIAALSFADLYAASRAAGRPMATADLMIASITRAWAARLVTRNTRDFEACGIELINPWEEV
jgi:predicted nucleic acid-binding protein